MAIIVKPDMSNIWASGGAIIAPSPAKVQTGWTPEIPPHQWENWVQNRQDEAISYLFQRGIAEWDATTEYSANGSFVQWNGKTYKAIANSINVPPSNTSSWKVWGLEIEDLPSASTTTQGVIEIATNPETIAGTDSVRAIPPSGLQARLAGQSITAGNGLSGGGTMAASRTLSLATPGTLDGSTTNAVTASSHTHAISAASATLRGVVELATNAETITGTDTARAVTPAGLTSRTALESRTGLVQLATTAEAQALANDAKALTPKKLADAFKGSNQILSVSGYQKIAGGLILQWGAFTLDFDSTSVAALDGITFPIAFPTAARAVIVQKYSGVGVGAGMSDAVINQTPFGFGYRATTSGNPYTGVGFTYFALGY